ncbi:MAG: TraX family protein [Intestinibacter bartlettii]|uniref:TraX family protein n=1 Tax=Intestinibacter bartlettii TaxID=261299 RepID=UPI00291454AF|nr:TraX family protein [Intestinibacter bartlettii]MDU6791760.1 TraX family protein [Anaerococcus sp.]MDU6824508.1 TraX family protein [Intestinibacter bartlettii]
MEKLKQIQKKFQINGAGLKYIAFISMFIDHFNKTIITPLLNYQQPLVTISTIFDIIGRIAFPIFAFMIVEGFYKTKSRGKYLRNLLIFAIISEVPYDMFQSKVFINNRSQNIMWALAIGLLNLIIVDKLKEKIKNKYAWLGISILIVAINAVVATLLSFDYDYYSIIIIFILYLFYDKRFLGSILSYLVIIKEVYAILGFAVINFYNGEKGRQNKLFNYFFYPAHLLILGLCRFWFGL